MASTFANFIVTTVLTLLCSALLVLFYRIYVRPILVRHNIIPLQHLPSTLSQRWSEYSRVPTDAEDDVDVEAGFLDGDSDSDDDATNERGAPGRAIGAKYTDEPRSSMPTTGFGATGVLGAAGALGISGLGGKFQAGGYSDEMRASEEDAREVDVDEVVGET